MQETKLCLKMINQNNIFEINSFYFKIIGINSSMIWEFYYVIFRKKLIPKNLDLKLVTSSASTSQQHQPVQHLLLL